VVLRDGFGDIRMGRQPGIDSLCQLMTDIGSTHVVLRHYWLRKNWARLSAVERSVAKT
jgi:hypothetical protein